MLGPYACACVQIERNFQPMKYRHGELSRQITCAIKTERTATSVHYDLRTAASNSNEVGTSSLQASAGMPVRKVCDYSLLPGTVNY